METTYRHLVDQDHVDAARRARGEETDDDTEEPALTPDTCPTCSEPLPPGAKACPDCGMVFSPDAQAVLNEAEQQIPQIQNETEAEIVSAVLSDVRENPEDYLSE